MNNLESDNLDILKITHSFDAQIGKQSISAVLSPKDAEDKVNGEAREGGLGHKEIYRITCTWFRNRFRNLVEVSSQIGCRIGCMFCGCGEFKRDLMPDEVLEQIRILQQTAQKTGISLDEVNKINFTDGGEILFNPHCIDIIRAVTAYLPLKIKISSVMPDAEIVRENLNWIMHFMQNYPPCVVFQISLYSTDEKIRQDNSNRKLMSFEELRQFGEQWLNAHPSRRKVTLTFTLTSKSNYVPEKIAEVLPPSLFVVRLHGYKPNNVEGIEPMDSEMSSCLNKKFQDLGYKTIYDVPDDFDNKQLIIGGTRTSV